MHDFPLVFHCNANPGIFIVSEILSLMYQNFKRSHNPKHSPFGVQSIMFDTLVLNTINLRTNVEVPRLTHSSLVEIWRGPKIQKRVMWPWLCPSEGDLTSHMVYLYTEFEDSSLYHVYASTQHSGDTKIKNGSRDWPWPRHLWVVCHPKDNTWYSLKTLASAIPHIWRPKT